MSGSFSDFQFCKVLQVGEVLSDVQACTAGSVCRAGPSLEVLARSHEADTVPHLVSMLPVHAAAWRRRSLIRVASRIGGCNIHVRHAAAAARARPARRISYGHAMWRAVSNCKRQFQAVNNCWFSQKATQQKMEKRCLPRKYRQLRSLR